MTESLLAVGSVKTGPLEIEGTDCNVSARQVA